MLIVFNLMTNLFRYYATNLSSPDRDYGRTVKTFNTEVEREFVLESDYLSEEIGRAHV
jgi:hypothetical protein